MQITLNAMAKINLFLNITGVLDNGYHTLDMVMQSINLYDTITMELNSSNRIMLSCSQEGIPCDKKNIAYQAAEKFLMKTAFKTGLHMHIEKNIPHQAGLGGGSADAAAVLHGLNHLLDNPLSLSQLCEIGVDIGADLPFCLHGGTCFVQGIGEKVTKINPLPSCFFVVVKPDFGISTKQAYAQFDHNRQLFTMDCGEMLHAIKIQDTDCIAKNLYNALETADVHTPVETIKQKLLQLGAKGALMSGSGSAVFGLFEDQGIAQESVCVLRKYYRQVCLTQPVEQGIIIKN